MPIAPALPVYDANGQLAYTPPAGSAYKVYFGRPHADDFTWSVVQVQVGTGGYTDGAATMPVNTSGPARTKVIPKGRFLVFGTKVIQLAADLGTSAAIASIAVVPAVVGNIAANTTGQWTPLMEVPNPADQLQVLFPTRSVNNESTWNNLLISTLGTAQGRQSVITWKAAPKDVTVMDALYADQGKTSDVRRRTFVGLCDDGSGFWGAGLISSAGKDIAQNRSDSWRMEFTIDQIGGYFDTAGNVIDFLD